VVKVVDEQPHLIFIAKEIVQVGEELLTDFGEKNSRMAVHRACPKCRTGEDRTRATQNRSQPSAALGAPPPPSTAADTLSLSTVATVVTVPMVPADEGRKRTASAAAGSVAEQGEGEAFPVAAKKFRSKGPSKASFAASFESYAIAAASRQETTSSSSSPSSSLPSSSTT